MQWRELKCSAAANLEISGDSVFKKALSLATLCILVMAVNAQATLTITSTPQATSGPFRHNVFHTAHTSGGAGGTILAWFDLDTTAPTSTYDELTGALAINIGIFTSSGLTTQIGTATGTGVGLVGSDLNLNLNNIVGTITWNFDMSLGSGSSLATHLGSNGHGTGGDTYSITQTFLDTDFVPSAENVPNGWDGTNLTLWGADGYTSGTTYGNATLGVDMVATAVPEPTSLMLTGLGLVGFAALRRRKR